MTVGCCDAVYPYHFANCPANTAEAEEAFPYEVVTAPLGNRFGARSLADVEHMKSIWTVTDVIDNTVHPNGSAA